MQDFAGQVAFITGGASGAGLGQAKVFGRAGCKVVIADIRQAAIDKALTELRAEAIEVHGIELDITDRAAYAAAADEVERIHGQAPTLLFNTAGVNNFGPIENTTYGDFDWLIGVNLGGVVNGMMTFVPRMIDSGKPCHVVTVASLGGFTGSALAGPYSAAKAAVVNLMEGYRQGLEKYGIGVSVVCPANIKSNIAEATLTRSAQYGETGYVEGPEAIASLNSIYQHGMEPEVLAAHVMQGIRDNALYIIPYPEVKDMLAGHFAQIVDAIPPLDTDPEGAQKRTEALMEWARGGAKVFTPGA
ncbi:SDR family NAD(P)-dependent oxidoreductase [Novosphingobium sp. B 225]|uniref:SDR family NAD(P)-dependent oxidoreductase n=1 Tax=Novosphingobium sp. B 225 TaxID=1961849 RepID=UPI000B4B47B0|nr:SDR family NAD(P)-dependent oxidoreductase [Novosphingobium sp. B 225]